MPSNDCQLGCAYCVSAHERSGAVRTAPRQATLDPSTARQAAQLVARNARRLGKPLTVVFHGGGEPTLHGQLLERLWSTTHEVAAEHGVPWWGYIATNGVMSEARARWLADHFDHIGLSCDGPPGIQDVQRPTARGGGSAAAVMRTARALMSSGAAFDLRVTITRRTMERQAEIASDLARTFGPRTIRFEPEYAGRAEQRSPFEPADAETFVAHHLHAQAIAAELGCDLQMSGVRPSEIHGPYCNVVRDVLQVTPDGAISACFAVSSAEDAHARGRLLARAPCATDAGPPHRDGVPHRLARERLRSVADRLRKQALTRPPGCRGCLNEFHCVGACPQACVATVAAGESCGSRRDGTLDDRHPAQSFRCRTFRLLTEAWIVAHARAAP